MKFWLCGLLVVMVVVACTADPIERNNAGNALSRQGAYDEALRAYEVALVNDPDNALYYFNTSGAFEGLGEIDRAIETLEQAIGRGDVSLQVASYHNLGNLYFRQGLYEEAIEAYRGALRLDGTSEDTRFNLALALSTRDLPTPTPREMQTSPEEEQADDMATPTPNPMNLAQPTPTPSPLPPPPDDEEVEYHGPGGEASDNENMPPSPEDGGELTLEDVERILEVLESNQETMGGLPDMPAIGTTPGVKDW